MCSSDLEGADFFAHRCRARQLFLNGARDAIVRIRTWEGSSKLSGTCTAKQPPGVKWDSRRTIRAMCSGTHCRTALAKIRSNGSTGRQCATSAFSNLSCGSRARACANMSSDESNPIISACGNLLARSSVELPGPQPRSTTRLATSQGTRLRRSIAGRVRSASNCKYCLALQSSNLTLLFGENRARRRDVACNEAQKKRRISLNATKLQKIY